MTMMMLMRNIMSQEVLQSPASLAPAVTVALRLLPGSSVQYLWCILGTLARTSVQTFLKHRLGPPSLFGKIAISKHLETPPSEPYLRDRFTYWFENNSYVTGPHSSNPEVLLLSTVQYHLNCIFTHRT